MHAILEAPTFNNEYTKDGQPKIQSEIVNENRKSSKKKHVKVKKTDRRDTEKKKANNSSIM